jgi:hypothetical protein
MMLKTFMVVSLASMVLMGATSFARADCEADLVDLESAMAAPGVSATTLAVMKDAGEKAATAMRKDDDATCHSLVTDALKSAGAAPAAAAASPSPARAGALGDLSAFGTIATDTLALVKKGNLAGAKLHIKDLEVAWDQARPKLHAMNVAAWDKMDGAIDVALTSLRVANPDAKACGDALAALLAVIAVS